MLFIDQCKNTIMSLPLDSIKQVDSFLKSCKFLNLFIHLFITVALQSFTILAKHFQPVLSWFFLKFFLWHTLSISVFFYIHKTIFHGFLFN